MTMQGQTQKLKTHPGSCCHRHWLGVVSSPLPAAKKKNPVKLLGDGWRGRQVQAHRRTDHDLLETDRSSTYSSRCQPAVIPCWAGSVYWAGSTQESMCLGHAKYTAPTARHHELDHHRSYRSSQITSPAQENMC